MTTYTDKDFVDVVDAEGNDLTHPIPKQWIGTDLAPDVKKKSGGSSSSSGSGDVEIPEGDPSDSWTVKQIDAYAKANEIDLGDASNKGEKLEAISKAKTAEVTGQ